MCQEKRFRKTPCTNWAEPKGIIIDKYINKLEVFMQDETK